MKKIILLTAALVVTLSLAACGKNSNDTKALYDETIAKFVSGEEMFSDEGEGYNYEDAEAPAYALYDIDGDGTDELFITPRKDSEWHTYTVFYIKDGVVTRGRALNGYLPDKNHWTYAFDFFVEAYEFNSTDGFARQWELDYPWVDGVTANTIYYEGQEPQELNDQEVDKLLKGHTAEPAGINWIDF